MSLVSCSPTKRWRVLTATLLLAVCSVSSRAAGQTDHQLAAWGALVGSPAGAYAPSLLVAAFQQPDSDDDGDNHSSWGALASTWKRAAVARNYNAGASFARTVGPREAFAITVSVLTPGCPNCDAEMMAGGDFESLVMRFARPHARDEFAVLFDASAGYGRWPRTDDGENISLAARLPLVVSRRVSRQSTLRGFFSPGFGWGWVAIDGTGTSALVPVLGGGIALVVTHMAVEVSSQRVVIPDPYGDFPATIGVAVRFSP